MSKTYVSADDFLVDSWRLAKAIRVGGWRPDWIVGLWRGGVFAGVSVHEYLKVSGWDVRHLPLKCSSYSGIDANTGTVEFTFAAETFAKFAPGEKILAVDDVFDTGRTAEALAERLRPLGVDFRIATVYWKPERNETSMKPDYFVRDVGSEWVVFPHEIEGLTKDEIREKSPVLADLLSEQFL